MLNPKFSAVFDYGCLAELALREAANMPIFRGKPLVIEAVYADESQTYFEGIRVCVDESNESPAQKCANPETNLN